MGIRNYGRGNTRIRSNTYYYRNKNKNSYKNQFKKVLICIMIVLIIIFIKKVNTNITNEAIRIVDKTLNYNITLEHKGTGLVAYVKQIPKATSMIIPVFNINEDMNINNKCVIPVEGVLYKKFGEIRKSNNIDISNEGIDIIVNSDKVKAIFDGEVSEIGKHSIYGNYIKIIHNDFESVYFGVNDIFIEKGDFLSKGQLIGTLKLKENKTNIFHFEIWEKGKIIDPLSKINF